MSLSHRRATEAVLRQGPPAPPKLSPRSLGAKGYGGSPGRSKEIRVGGQRLLDYLLERLLLLLGLLYPLLGHLLEGLLLFLCQLHPLLGGLLEGLLGGSLPLLLWLLRNVEGWCVEELDVGIHGLLHHLLEGLLLPLELIGHGLHRSDPSPSDLFGCLLAPACVFAHVYPPSSRPISYLKKTLYPRTWASETMS